MKSLLGIFIISLLSASWNVVPSYSKNVTVEDHVLTAFNDKSSAYVRIYSESGATSIGEHAFDDCTFTTLMVSNAVRENNAAFPNTLTTLEYTGALSDISFAVLENITVVEYACDEGFINYWNEFIRPNIDGSICNVTKDHYVKMKALYAVLESTQSTTNDLEVVNSTEDGTGTIKDSVKFLDNYFGNSHKSQMGEKEISQSVMITLILIIASFGMTSIGLFYFLKDRNVIK